PNPLPDGTAALKAYLAAVAFQPRDINRPEDRAVAERLPIHAVRGIQDHFKRVGLPALALRGAKQDVDPFGPSTPVRMRDQHCRVQPLLFKVAVPDRELRSHDGPWRQPEPIAVSSAFLWRPSSPVKYLSRLPRGKTGLRSVFFTTVRVMLPSTL